MGRLMNKAKDATHGNPLQQEQGNSDKTQGALKYPLEKWQLPSHKKVQWLPVAAI